MACFVGLTAGLETGLEVFAVAVLVGFEELTLGIVGLGGTGFTELTLGLDGVALDGVTLGLGGVFLAGVGWGFLETAAWSNKAESDFALEGLVLVVAGMVGFFLLSAPAFVFLVVLLGLGFEGVGFEGF